MLLGNELCVRMWVSSMEVLGLPTVNHLLEIGGGGDGLKLVI